MAHRSGIGSDEIVRMISLFAEAGRNSIDWAALLRIVAEHRNEVVEARRDRAIVDEWLGKDTRDDLLEPPVADAEVLSIKLNSILLGMVVRTGQSWQRLLERQAPAFRRVLEAYQSQDDPSPDRRRDVMHQFRDFMGDVSAVIRDQASLLEDDLRRMHEEILPSDEEGVLWAAHARMAVRRMKEAPDSTIDEST
ncbi:MAG: hypothetical protein U1F52_21890 [Burkholderiales bacterium]